MTEVYRNLPPAGAPSDLWVVTSFYNPEGYRRRITNFKRFKRDLTVPLVVVELSFNGQYHIDTDAAEIVVRIPGSAVLWQKERLLNIALEHVPRDVSHIAWLDCDVLFGNTNWPVDAAEHLKRFPLVQLFSELHDLGPGDDNLRPGDINVSPSGSGIAWLVATGGLGSDHFSPKTTRLARHRAFGLAWAANRALLESHGFYDAMILGSGDRAMACAAYGRFNDAIESCHLNERRAAHYLAWAKPFYESVQANVGYLPGTLFHLWHGDLANRGYRERHIALAQLEFDPAVDIHVDENGAWAWTQNRPEIAALTQQYFKSRLEDGAE